MAIKNIFRRKKKKVSSAEKNLEEYPKEDGLLQEEDMKSEASDNEDIDFLNMKQAALKIAEEYNKQNLEPELPTEEEIANDIQFLEDDDYRKGIIGTSVKADDIYIEEVKAKESRSSAVMDAVNDDSISGFIYKRIEEMAEKGFRPVYEGRELIRAVKERQERLFEEMVVDVTKTMMYNVIRKSKEKKESRPIVLDEYFFFNIARSNFKITRESFELLFEGDNAQAKVMFTEKDFDKIIEHIVDKNRDKSGMDAFSELFFQIFKKENQIREHINIPSAEHIMEFTV